jgi:Asp-tRNA(Asn)/Glu-tRNA(Gln) amidotransferase A subunit family amidase
MTELYELGLHDAAKRIRSGKLKPSTYMQSLLARIDAMDGTVKAWQWLDRERAMEMARAADGAATPWKAAHPLHGVPVGVKDNFYTAGIPTQMGCKLYEGYIPEETAAVVVRLERSGALMLGKTVTTEAAFMVAANTTNPWNPKHTPGGSSSGSAAAVAAGFVPAAIGTQTNGSVVRPAAFCGIVGYKPSQCMLSTRGVMPFSPSLDQPGVFARSVADAALLAWGLTARRSSISPDAPMLKGAPRLAAVRSPVWYLTRTEQREQFEADIARLRTAGAMIDIVEVPGEFDRAHKVHRTIMLFEAARVSRKVREHYRDTFSEYLNNALDEGDAIADADYRDALKLRTQLQHSLAAFLDRGYSAIITPPAAGEAPASLHVTGDPSFCSIWTLMGTPAITIPTGKGPNGLPLGLQLVGAVDEDNYLLSTAAWCERHSPFKGLV